LRRRGNSTSGVKREKRLLTQMKSIPSSFRSKKSYEGGAFKGDVKGSIGGRTQKSYQSETWKGVKRQRGRFPVGVQKQGRNISEGVKTDKEFTEEGDEV